MSGNYKTRAGSDVEIVFQMFYLPDLLASAPPSRPNIQPLKALNSGPWVMAVLRVTDHPRRSVREHG
jgi:hypothetical protein